MIKFIGVRLQHKCKIYSFDTKYFDLSLGDMVIVLTEQNLSLGQIVWGPKILTTIKNIKVNKNNKKKTLIIKKESITQDTSNISAIQGIERLATEEDLAQIETNELIEKESLFLCLENIKIYKLEMNLVKVECLFDRSKIIFYFTSENRLDFRELVRDLAKDLHTRVEFRQIGIRHEAKLLGGLGSCGREICCSLFLKKFIPVSVKIAKKQNLSLNPTKISGLCNRLMCCLSYEYNIYTQNKKDIQLEQDSTTNLKIDLD